jgi:uncharacterized protein YdeI (YjbR/CyaY-like superfamily)
MITEIEDFFANGCGRCPRFETPSCSVHIWRDGLANLRRICLELGLEEHVKWGHPCYMFAGRNVAIFGAFRGDFRLTFFNAALLQDPESRLERQGPNTQNPDMLRFKDSAEVVASEAIIRDYLKEAMDCATAGKVAVKTPREIDMPDELIEALDVDPELCEAFYALTPGRQKSYAFNLNQAKTSATRVSRIEKFRLRILAGKGAQER